MIREDGLSVGQVCRDLDLTDSAVRNWVAKYDAEQRGEPVGGLPLTPEQRRIRELERENQQLKQDVALLKKCLDLLLPRDPVMQHAMAEMREKASVVHLCRLFGINHSDWYPP